MGIACSSAAIFFMWLSHHCWVNTEVTLAAVKARVIWNIQDLMSMFFFLTDTCTKTEEPKTINGNRPSSCSIRRSNRTIIHRDTAHLRQQIFHQSLNITSALLTMKTWIIRFSILFIFLTIEPRDADGFNKHSEENRCSCCKVVKQSEHIHPTLEKHREWQSCAVYYRQTDRQNRTESGMSVMIWLTGPRMKLTLVTQKSEIKKVEATMNRVNSSLCLWRNLNSSSSPVITDSIPPIWDRRHENKRDTWEVKCHTYSRSANCKEYSATKQLFIDQ